VRALPGDAPQYDVQMVWHATAEREPAHLWLRALVRRLFARGGVTSTVPDTPGSGAGRSRRSIRPREEDHRASSR
jgi:hypothetical protein